MNDQEKTNMENEIKRYEEENSDLKAENKQLKKDVTYFQTEYKNAINRIAILNKRILELSNEGQSTLPKPEITAPMPPVKPPKIDKSEIQQKAHDIRLAVSNLNYAMEQAAQTGIQTNLESVNVTDMECPVPLQMLNVEMFIKL